VTLLGPVASNFRYTLSKGFFSQNNDNNHNNNNDNNNNNNNNNNNKNKNILRYVVVNSAGLFP